MPSPQTIGRKILIAGGSMSALRSAEALRGLGFKGEIVVIGEEPYMPYNRPPLSKVALINGISHKELAFRLRDGVQDVIWRLGERIIGADLSKGSVTLSSGTALGFDGLIIATGVRPRRLKYEGQFGGCHQSLRTLDEAVQLKMELTPGKRVAVIGAGFIGCEVSASLRTLGLDVDVIALERTPMLRPLGDRVGKELQRRHEARGVRFHLEQSVLGFATSSKGKSVLCLSGGSEIEAEVVIEAVGTVANVDWLQGNGLDTTDGILTDNYLSALGSPIPAVAVGDIARYPNPRFGPAARRVEHWTNPSETARVAARTLLEGLGELEEREKIDFAPIPSFWSDQFDFRIQSFGILGAGASAEPNLLLGDLEGEAALSYLDGDTVVGTVSLGLSSRQGELRALVDDSTTPRLLFRN